MMIGDPGTVFEMISVAVMPSMSGMLMSMRIASGFRSLAIAMACWPVAALPTTSKSGSNPRSFERFSRVSAMSSTMRMRIFADVTTMGLGGYFASLVQAARGELGSERERDQRADPEREHATRERAIQRGRQEEQRPPKGADRHEHLRVTGLEPSRCIERIGHEER